MANNISKYPLMDMFSKRLVEYCNADELIDEILAEFGNELGIDSIVICEDSEGDGSLRAVFEWNKNGEKELINCERRFTDKDLNYWNSNPNELQAVYLWNNKQEKKHTRLVRPEITGSLMQIAIVVNDVFKGSVDFISIDPNRAWSYEEIEEAQCFSEIYGNYSEKIKARNEQFSKQAASSMYDRTTHLPKYEYFVKQVEMSLFELDTSQLVIASIDFSNFKLINEKRGHSEGDNFLEQVARNIYDYSKFVVTSCRSHSDNFLVLIKCNKMFTKTRIRLKLESVAEELIKQYSKKYFDIALCVNIGFYCIKNKRESIEEVITNANIARKFSKLEQQSNGHCCLNYEPVMSQKFRTQAEYIAEMSKGLDRGEFYFDIQPIYRNDTKEIIAGEALVRWKKDNFYKLMPTDFIPLFEKDGCVVKMDAFTYAHIFEYIRKRLDAGKKVVPIILNVSIIHLNYDVFVDFFDQLQREYNIPTELIGFDFPEQAFTSKNASTRTVIDALRERGYKVYVDNFGAGFSSLNTLTSYDLDGINIDRNFMKSTLTREDKIIVSCVIDMASKLSLAVRCEGVETEEQRNFLVMSGCDYIQGNLLSEPLSVADFEELIEG